MGEIGLGGGAKTHAPGLSARKAMTAAAFEAMCRVSRRGGLGTTFPGAERTSKAGIWTGGWLARSSSL